jgi:hypothetical protein
LQKTGLIASLPWSCTFCEPLTALPYSCSTYAEAFYHTAITHRKLFQALTYRKDPRMRPVLLQLFPEKHRQINRNLPGRSTNARGPGAATAAPAPEPAAAIGNTGPSTWLLAGTFSIEQPRVIMNVNKEDSGDEEREWLKDAAEAGPSTPLSQA